MEDIREEDLPDYNEEGPSDERMAELLADPLNLVTEIFFCPEFGKKCGFYGTQVEIQNHLDEVAKAKKILEELNARA